MSGSLLVTSSTIGGLSLAELAIRLGVAALAGGLLGFEREWKRKPAGLRTHMLVSLGGACFCLAAFGLASETGTLAAQGIEAEVDPTRVLQGLVGGIGFLAAGAILRDRDGVEGLTTAGSIWLAGALGMAVGAGNYDLAALTVALATAILLLVGWLEHRARPHG